MPETTVPSTPDFSNFSDFSFVDAEELLDFLEQTRRESEPLSGDDLR